MSTKIMAKLKALFYSVLFFAGGFSIFSIILYFGDWERLAAVALMGGFIGIIAAPELYPEHFDLAWIYQLVAGCFAGAILGYILGGDVEIISISFFVGGVLGFFAPSWIKHVQIP